MRISTRGQYGLRAMCRLVLLQRAGGSGPVSLRDIAEKEDISSQYLEQLFRGLRGAGLVESVRGAKGGYILARPPEEISVADILRAVEGPIAPVECVESDSVDACCDRKDYCMTREAWIRLRDSMVETLDSINLADLCKPGELGRGSTC
ncbi:MAG TPA: Rrf2 family transcriptional regulator [Firmicutes bacterium]|nr:Rrf2 family transcriptional regulator [Bacillota bacterium]